MNWQPDLYTVCLTGLGASALGLAGLVARPRSAKVRRRPVGVLTALAVLAGGGAAALARLPEVVWLPPLALAAAWLLLVGLRQPAVTSAARIAWATARNRFAHCALLLVAGPALFAWQAYRMNEGADVSDLPAAFPGAPKSDDVVLEPLADRFAVTDAGHVVRLYSLASAEGGDNREEEARRQWYQELAHQMIRTGDAYPTCNCHGWVFAGGQHWIHGRDVDLILHDNGYRAVTAPQAGDVAVFRSAQGHVEHTGVVRGTDAEGKVLIESKLGRYGRFIHTAEQHPYPDTVITYYHSRRGGNLLRGLSGGDGEVSALAVRATSTAN